MATLLVIDDEPAILHAFRRAFREPAVTLLTAGSATQGIELFSQYRPEVVIVDVNLPDLSGLETFRHIQLLDARTPVIFITGQGTTDTAIEAMKLGAYDYLLKPLELNQLRELVTRAFKISGLMRIPVPVPGEEPTDVQSEVLVGRCAAMQDVYKAIGRVAPQDVTVLILGESGTGKELVARAIYQHSLRSASTFLAINCAAIPETLLETELFGHERGAFTGAERLRIGKFEQCSGGTLFLDEIGDMTPLTQSKILRALQDQQFERVGGTETIRTNVRLIAATHGDLEQLVAAGKFRSDLYYRLSVFTIKLPPLQERGEDLALLTDYFLRRFSRELGKNVQTIDPETMEKLQRYRWPGNIRELQSVLKQSLLQATGPVLLPEFLPAFLRTGDTQSPSAVPGSAVAAPAGQWERFITDRLSSSSENLYAEWLAVTDRLLLTRVLRHTGGNQVQAAKILGITRGTLRAKIRALGIIPDLVAGTEDTTAD